MGKFTGRMLAEGVGIAGTPAGGVVSLRLPRHPRHAVGFDCDQHRVPMKEDLVQAQGHHAYLTDAIQRWLGERELASTAVHTAAGRRVIEGAADGARL